MRSSHPSDLETAQLLPSALPYQWIHVFDTCQKVPYFQLNLSSHLVRTATLSNGQTLFVRDDQFNSNQTRVFHLVPHAWLACRVLRAVAPRRVLYSTQHNTRTSTSSSSLHHELHKGSTLAMNVRYRMTVSPWPIKCWGSSGSLEGIPLDASPGSGCLSGNLRKSKI